jgi:hypothetical protein
VLQKKRGDPGHVIGAARELFLRRTRKVGRQKYLLNPVGPRQGGQEGPLGLGEVDRETVSRDGLSELKRTPRLAGGKSISSIQLAERLYRETGSLS